MSCTSEGQTWECTVRIVDAPCILDEEERRVTAFLESLRPDCIVIISVIVCTCKRYIEEGTTCELSIEIDAVPLEVQVETECKLRTVRAAEISAVIPVDLTVTIDILVLDVTYIWTCTVPGRIVDLLL